MARRATATPTGLVSRSCGIAATWTRGYHFLGVDVAAQHGVHPCRATSAVRLEPLHHVHVEADAQMPLGAGDTDLDRAPVDLALLPPLARTVHASPPDFDASVARVGG